MSIIVKNLLFFHISAKIQLRYVTWIMLFDEHYFLFKAIFQADSSYQLYVP